MVLTVWRSFGSPFLSVRVTGPDAPDQVRLKGEPATIPLKVVSVNRTALATEKAAAAARSLENCMFALAVLGDW